jgi:hypothetical protein
MKYNLPTQTVTRQCWQFPEVSIHQSCQRQLNANSSTIKSIIFLLLFLIPEFSYSQNIIKIKEGGYSNIENFNNNTPDLICQFNIKKRTKGAIISFGGNDYDVDSDSISNSILKNKIWGIFKDDTLYINGMGLVGAFGYCKVEILGEFMYVRPMSPVKPKYKKEFGIPNNPSYGSGAVGGAVQGASSALSRIPVIIKKTTGKNFILTKESILPMIKNHTELNENFKSEPDQDNIETLLKYIRMLNKDKLIGR